MSFLHLRELNATERSSRTTRKTGQGLFCIGTAAAGTEQRDLERRAVGKTTQGEAATARAQDRTTLGLVDLLVPSKK